MEMAGEGVVHGEEALHVGDRSFWRYRRIEDVENLLDGRGVGVGVNVMLEPSKSSRAIRSTVIEHADVQVIEAV